MRILHLEASSGWGGQEMRILKESIGMREKGHEVVLGVMKGGGLIEPACKARFTCYPLNFKKPGWPVCLFQLLSIIRRHKIDLVNTHSSLDAWIGGIAARIAGKKVVRTRHLSTPIKPGMNSRLLYGKLADAVVTTCERIIPMISAQSGKRLELCKSVATGVDPSKIVCSDEEAKKIKASWGFKDEDFVVGTACFLRSWKGIRDFLEAADLLRREKGLKWVLIGGGHEKEYREYAKELKLEGTVHFTGHLENPFPALKALDVFALLSTAHEGVSQAILQAAYLEKPLIATPVGGLDEVCLMGRTGLLVEPFSASQVAQAVMELKGQPFLRKEMGGEGRRLVLEWFTMDRTLKEMEAVYETLHFQS